MASTSHTQLKLQKAIHQNASQFLHLHMLPLKTLPKVLKHATPHGNTSNGPGSIPKLDPNNPRHALSVLNSTQHMRHDSSSNLSIASFASSTRVSELEAEEKSLREQLIVLEEQKFMVQEMIADANRRRKFDEVAALAGNVEDLSVEIDSVQKLVDNLRGEFEGVYASFGNSTGLGSGLSTPQRKPSDSGKRTSGKMKIVENG